MQMLSSIKLNLIKETNEITLVFTDDGTGFNPGMIEKKVPAGMGLSNIVSRIRSLKGNYSMNSEANKGFEFKTGYPFNLIAIDFFAN